MAAGDDISNIATIVASGTLTIQPPSGAEWIVHNVYYDNAVNFKITNGTISCQYGQDLSAGAIEGRSIRLTNTLYMQIINPSASISINVAYTGVASK